MAKVVTLESILDVKKGLDEEVQKAKLEASKRLKQMIEAYDFAAEETRLIEELRNVYRIWGQASELGAEVDWRPSRLTAAIRGVADGGARSSGGSAGGGGRRGAVRESILETIKANGNPMKAGDIAAKLGMKEANVRQAILKLVDGGELASLKQTDNGNFRAVKKGERGGFYGLPG